MSGSNGWYEPLKTVLLTGAGFTKTFGGYLGSEMWAAILNQPEVQSRPKLVERMLENQNYELFYHEVQSGESYSAWEKRAVNVAVRRAYDEMEDTFCDQSYKYYSSAYGASSSFIGRFAGKDNLRGFVFTLNQDMFTERFYREDTVSMNIPGIPRHRHWFKVELGQKWGSEYRIKLPTQAELEEATEGFGRKGSGSFMYFKLHGSYGWLSHDEADAGSMMVIGAEKQGMIDREPLLRWYFSIFNEVLSQPRVNLVTVGYGFRDAHINRLLADKIVQNGLRLIVVSPQSPDEFRRELEGLSGFNISPKPKGSTMWHGIAQYWPCDVTEFYVPARGKPTDLTPRGWAFFSRVGLL